MHKHNFNTTLYADDTLKYKVCSIEKTPKFENKSSFLLTSKLFLTQANAEKRKIYEQIFVLTKTYNSIVSRSKNLFETNFKDFVTLSNTDGAKQSSTLRALINSQIEQLVKAIKEYSVYEANVKNNIDAYSANCKACSAYIKNGVKTFNLNNAIIANLASDMPNKDEFADKSFPISYYCKKDLENKIQLANSLCSDFIKTSNSKTSSTTINNNSKGDFSI